MKKLIFITLVLSLSLFACAKALAAVTPTTTPSVSASEEEINSLKDRIASRVAQLNLVEKKGFIGTVTDTSETQITVTDTNDTTRIIDVDELTNFSSPTANATIGISDISKGTVIGAIGLYNKDSRRLLARYIDILNLPQILSGGVLSINNDDFTFTVATLDKESTTIDVEDITKTTSYTKVGGVVKSGFSKIVTGERVLVVGFPDIHNKDEIIASRIILFPDLPVNPRIPMVKPEDIAPVTPSTGSGKKITPITK